MMRGKLASARCRSCSAATSNIRRARVDDSLAVSARTAHTTISSSGGTSAANRVSSWIASMEDQCRLAAGFETLSEGPARLERKQPHRRPESYGRGSGPRAFERDLAEVQLG